MDLLNDHTINCKTTLVLDLRPQRISSPNHLLFFLPTETELFIMCPAEDIIQKERAAGLVKITNIPGCKISSRMFSYFTNSQAPMATLHIKKDIFIPSVLHYPPMGARNKQSQASNDLQLMVQKQPSLMEVYMSRTYDHITYIYICSYWYHFTSGHN